MSAFFKSLHFLKPSFIKSKKSLYLKSSCLKSSLLKACNHKSFHSRQENIDIKVIIANRDYINSLIQSKIKDKKAQVSIKIRLKNKFYPKI